MFSKKELKQSANYPQLASKPESLPRLQNNATGKSGIEGRGEYAPTGWWF